MATRSPHATLALLTLLLVSTKSFGYSHMNLNGMLALCTLGQRVGVDVLHYETPDGRSIRRALDYMMQYSDPAKKWPDKQIIDYHPADLYDLALRGGVLYGDETLLKLAEKLSGPKQQESRLRMQLNR
ncbi:MAG: alginate lyase family protein [Tepidisphaeraceae bacterium]